MGIRWGWVVNAMPSQFYCQEKPCTHCIGSRWAPGLVWIDAENFASTRIWSMVASCCTDWAIPAHILWAQSMKWSSYLWRELCITASLIWSSKEQSIFVVRVFRFLQLCTWGIHSSWLSKLGNQFRALWGRVLVLSLSGWTFWLWR